MCPIVYEDILLCAPSSGAWVVRVHVLCVAVAGALVRRPVEVAERVRMPPNIGPILEATARLDG